MARVGGVGCHVYLFGDKVIVVAEGGFVDTECEGVGLRPRQNRLYLLKVDHLQGFVYM